MVGEAKARSGRVVVDGDALRERTAAAQHHLLVSVVRVHARVVSEEAIDGQWLEVGVRLI